MAKKKKGILIYSHGKRGHIFHCILKYYLNFRIFISRHSRSSIEKFNKSRNILVGINKVNIYPDNSDSLVVF